MPKRCERGIHESHMKASIGSKNHSNLTYTFLKLVLFTNFIRQKR